VILVCSGWLDDLVPDKLVFWSRGIMVQNLGSGRWIGLKTNLRLGPNSCEDLTFQLRREHPEDDYSYANFVWLVILV
jgi:hypothetical protein